MGCFSALGIKFVFGIILYSLIAFMAPMTYSPGDLNVRGFRRTPLHISAVEIGRSFAGNANQNVLFEASWKRG